MKGPDQSSNGLRTALLIGFGGMLLIFLVAIVDAVRLLDRMREANNVLRQASLDRSRHLASVRTYVLLSHTYLIHSQDGDTARLATAWSRVRADLDGYRACSPEEAPAIYELQQLVGKHKQDMDSANPELLRADFIKITTRLQDVDAKQLAWTESEIERSLEDLGTRLRTTLIIALAAALLLALGCLVYILRVERQSRRRYGEAVASRGALEQLSARMVNAQEEERRAISRELHDEVGQTLSALLVDAANLANRIPADDAVGRRYLDNIRSLADSSVNSLRDIALLLRPSMLDDLGLIPALEWQAREVSRRSDVKVKVVAENVSDSLPDPLRTSVYRVVQEALHNVSSHAQAKNAVVTVNQDNGALTLTVEDDGVGFDPKRTKGLGLLGIEERVKRLGGRLQIESTLGRGTHLRISLPLTTPADAPTR